MRFESYLRPFGLRIVFLNIVLFANSVAFSQPGIETEPNLDHPAESENLHLLDPLDGDAASELAFGQGELRETHRFGILGGVGLRAPWASISGRGLYRLTEEHPLFISVGVGMGNFPSRTKLGPEQARMNVDAVQGDVGVRYYPSKKLPFFVRGAIGAVKWEGTHTFENANFEDSLSESSVSGQGITYAAEVGVSYHFPFGLFIENSLLGVGAATPLSIEAEEKAESDIEEHFRQTQIWGLFNFAVGYIW